MARGNQLREFVRACVREAAHTATTASEKGLALMVRKERASDATRIVLYDPASLVRDALSVVSEVAAGTDLTNPFSHEVSSAMQLSLLGQASFGPTDAPCYEAWEVRNVAADKGYGPLMYDIMMSMSPSATLISDRSSVSSSAEAVWKKYKERGGGAHGPVEALPLDDVNDPKTPPTEDDCYVFPDKRNSLNYAYRIENPVDVYQLRANHLEAVKQIALGTKKLGLSYQEGVSRAESWIRDAASTFFFDAYIRRNSNDPFAS